MVNPGHAADALVRVDQHRFGGLEAFAGRKQPAEPERIDADRYTCSSVLIDIGICSEAAAVDQAEAISLPAVFTGLRGEEGQERILLVAAGSALTVNALPSAVKGSANEVAFAGPGPGQLERLVVVMRKIERLSRSEEIMNRAFDAALGVGENFN